MRANISLSFFLIIFFLELYRKISTRYVTNTIFSSELFRHQLFHGDFRIMLLRDMQA